MSGRRIGVYVCQCGGNISDYLSVDEVVAAVQNEPGVVVARTAMFTCSDATQQEIVRDIEEQNLDGIVVASCSPKLHTFTFREMSKRAGLNPYEYTQVNIREQCSWTHTDDNVGATEKAARLVRAGIARTRLTEPLEPIVVETVPNVVVVGGGIAGLRAALGLAEIGLAVFLVEKEPELGGWVGDFGEMYPQGKNGRELIAGLVERVRSHPGITVFTEAEATGKSGSFGNYEVAIRVKRGAAEGAVETITVQAGSIIVATGFDAYEVSEGEYGYGLEGVVTLSDFKRLVDATDGPLEFQGRLVRSLVYIYCVGSQQAEGNQYCSRYCCAAAIHASLQAAAKGTGPALEIGAALAGGSGGRLSPDAGGLRQYHLYRDIRTYGKYELLYNRSREKGALYLRFPDDEPPLVKEAPKSSAGAAGYRLTVTVRDLLTGGEELVIPADLVVLVTGMVPRENGDLVRVLKLPVGSDGFFNEIHPKLRPVETVVDGVFICGACQGPKNSAEAVASGLAAVAQSATLLKRGFAELDPLISVVDGDACVWCGACLEACPYGAPRQVEVDGRAVAFIDETTCKGCGGCVPVCPKNAIDLQGYTDAQIRAMIDGLLQELSPCRQ